MVVDSALVPSGLNWLLTLLYGVAMFSAVRMAPWRKLRDPEQLHVFLGAVVVLLGLWHLRAQVQPGLAYHLLGVTAVTLMFGWSMAVIAASLALLGVSFDTG
jgi:uncharacterized membrane protein